MITLDISTHGGENHTVEVDEYDAVATNDLTNDETLNTIVLGDVVISRIDIKAIVPRKLDEI